MEFFCGLDVAMDVDDHGAVHLETTAVTDPDALFAVLKPFLRRLRCVGHEAGSLSPWPHPELKKLGLPAVCLETQHVRAAMSRSATKPTGRCARHRPYHAHRLVPTGSYRVGNCYRTKLVLTHRRNLKTKFLDLENAIRHSLKSFGIRLGKVGRRAF